MTPDPLDVTTDPRYAETDDPWQWLHDNDFSWDDVNAIAAILGERGWDITRPEPPRRSLVMPLVLLAGAVGLGLVLWWWLR